MKTKRVVVRGSAAFAGSLARQSAPLLLTVALFGATALACKSGNGQENGTPADPGPAAPQGGDVVRYTGMEVVETGQTGIRQAVQARRAADWSSPTVATLYPGTQISRVARYGNFSLVAWSGAAGAQQGWVDTNVAFSAQRIDAGTGTMKPAPVFGAVTVTAPPTVTTPPTSTTPPKTTAAPTVTAPRTGFQPRTMQ
jgi:hypothetical protein